MKKVEGLRSRRYWRPLGGVVVGTASLVLLSCLHHGIAIACLADPFLWTMFGIGCLLLGTLMLGEERSLRKEYDPKWRTVCPALGGDHEHDGAVLRGIWEGRPFCAVAYRMSGTQYSASVEMYKVTMTSERRGPAWQVVRIGEGKGHRKEAAWRLRTDRSSTEKRLVDAGLLRAIEEADAPVRHLHNDFTMSYDPRDNQVVYQDSSGDVPSAEDFIAHLKLVRRLVDINSVASESAANVDDESRNASGTLRLHLRVGSPPVWTMCLWLPASFVGVTLSDSWPWTLALLSIAFIPPLAWRIRIGRG